MSRMPVAQRRELLLAAAWRVLCTRGVAAATTRAICEEAGMPQGAFHYCFTSRDELLHEVATGLLPAEISAAGAEVGAGGTLGEAIERALVAYWELVEDDPGPHQVLYEITTAALRTPGGRDVAEMQYRRYAEGAVQVLERISAARRICWLRPVDVLARQIVSVLDGLTLHYLVDGDSAVARATLAAFAADLAKLARRDGGRGGGGGRAAARRRDVPGDSEPREMVLR